MGVSMSGSQPVQLSGLSCLAVHVPPPGPPYRTERAQYDATDDPGILPRLTIGPDHMTVDSDTPAKLDVDVQISLARFRIAGDEGVGIQSPAAGLAQKEQAFADRLQHVVLAGPPGGEMPPDGLGRELKRSIDCRLHVCVVFPAPAPCRDGELNNTIAPGTGSPDPRSVTLPRINMPRAKARSTEYSSAPFGQSKLRKAIK